MKRKIAVLLGVLFVMGLVVSPMLAQTLPGLSEPQVQEVEIQLPDTSGWETAQAMGFDTNLDGQTDYYTKVFINEKAEGDVLVREVLQMNGRFGQEPELVIWQAVEKTFEGRQKGRFQRPIIRKDDGKYYEVSPQVFQAKVQEFLDGLPQYSS